MLSKSTLHPVPAFLISLLAITVNVCAYVASTPPSSIAQAAKRGIGDIFSAALKGAASGALSTVFGKPPTCCGYNSDSGISGCLVNTGVDSAGTKWMACYEPGNATMEQTDINAMDCITNLFSQQKDRCIDVAGSVCAAGGKQYRISAKTSSALQQAIASMLNVGFDYDSKGDNSITVATVSDENGDLESSLDFVGHQAPDC